jgi:hypothetical protein
LESLVLSEFAAMTDDILQRALTGLDKTLTHLGTSLFVN